MIVLVNCCEQLRAVKKHHDGAKASRVDEWHAQIFEEDAELERLSSVVIQPGRSTDWRLHKQSLQYHPNMPVLCFNEWKRRTQ